MLLEKLDWSVWLNNIILLFHFLGGKKTARETSDTELKRPMCLCEYTKNISFNQLFSEILDGNGKCETVAIELTTFP